MDLSQSEWIYQLKNDRNAVIIDVRTPDEWNDGRIENAINIDIYKGQGFIYLLDELDKDKNYFVYCRSGARSTQACKIMKQLDFKNTFNLIGGMMKWQGKIVND